MRTQKIGSNSESYNTISGFNVGITAILANTANITAHGGVPAHDTDADTYSATVKCHDANGEIYMVVFSRDQVTLSSYENENIRTTVETWADSVPELA